MHVILGTAALRAQLQSLDRRSLEIEQLARLNALVAQILPHNQLYAQAFRDVELPLRTMADLEKLPYTTKEQLLGEGGMAANRTWPIEHYVRFHQTSGTRGRPLVFA